MYHLDQAIEVTHPDTVVLGLGFPTVVPDNGKAAIRALNARGDIFSGLLFDAGVQRSDVLLQVGNGNDAGDASDPALLAATLKSFQRPCADPVASVEMLVIVPRRSR